MSGNKCQYMDCGKTKKKFPNLRMYRFPNDERKIIWVINAGNSSLYSIDHEQLHNRYICENHFPPDSFTNYVSKHRLLSNAVPYKYKAEEQPSTSSSSNLNFKYRQLYIPTPPSTITLTDSISDIKTEVIDLSYPSYTNTCTDLNSDFIKTEVLDPSYPSYLPTHKSKIIDKIQSHIPNSNKDFDSIETDTPEKLQTKTYSKIICNSKTNKSIRNLINSPNNFKNLVNMHNFPSINSKAMVKMQLKDRSRPWTLSEKKNSFKHIS